MARQKNEREDVEDLYGEIRRLRKLVEQQKREISRLQKYRNMVASAPSHKITTPSYRPPQKKNEELCESCGGVDFSVTTLNLRDGIRVLSVCKGCGSRKVTK